MRRLSWAPINFRRWTNFALVLGRLGADCSSSLSSAIGSMNVSWDRLGDDIDKLFQPSGPPGTHAVHHYHGPVDPKVRERVLAAAIADYESSLMYLDISLQLSVEALHNLGDLTYRDWKKLVLASEAGEQGLSSEAREIVLYLQRTPLYVRNDAIVHPKSMLPMTSHDNVGNLYLFRFSPKSPSPNDFRELDALIHSVIPEISSDAVVGRDITPMMALNWLGTSSHLVDDWKALNRLRETFGFLLPSAYEIGPKVDEMVSHFIAAIPQHPLKDNVFALQTESSHPCMADGEQVAPPSPRKLSAKKYEARLNAGITAGNAGKHKKAAKLFKACVADDPEEGRSHFLLAQALKALGYPADALEHLHKAEALGGANPGEIQRELITSHFNVASGAFNKKDYKLAIAHYSRALHLHPTDVESHRHLMEALGAYGDHDAALWHAGILLEDHPEDHYVHLDGARLFLNAGERTLALHHAEVALELRPEWPEASALRDDAQRIEQ